MQPDHWPINSDEWANYIVFKLLKIKQLNRESRMYFLCHSLHNVIEFQVMRDFPLVLDTESALK